MGGGEVEGAKGVGHVRDPEAPWGWIQNMKGQRVPRGKPAEEGEWFE